MRYAFRQAIIVAGLCLVFACCLYVTDADKEPIRADETVAGDAVLIGRLSGAMAQWRGDLQTWRQLIPGDSVQRALRMRVSQDGCAELQAGAARVVLGPGAQAVLLPDERRTTTLRLTSGALQATSAANRPLRIVTPYGRLDLPTGVATVSCTPSSATFSLRQGTASLEDNTSAKHALAAGEALECSTFGAHTATLAAALNFVESPRAVEARSVGRLVARPVSYSNAEPAREALPLEVRDLRVRAHVAGAMALTEVEETFFNSTGRQMEGTFYFPIPAGASLSRFAMYVNDTLVEGELVARAQAREVYEGIVRKLQDPALMEWQEGNIFKTRIFPIPAHGPKRILLSYTQVLPSQDGERRYVYPLAGSALPGGAIGAFEFEAEVSGVAAEPQAAAYPDMETRIENGCATMRLKREQFQPAQDVVLRLPVARNEALKLVADRRAGEDGFFMFSYLGNSSAAKTEPATRSGRDVVVLLDTSLSRRADDYKAQLKVVQTLLRELGPNDRFAVLSFDVTTTVHSPTFVSGKAAVEKTLAALENTVPLGATDLEGAFNAAGEFLKANAPRGQADIICLSDGVATLGETAPEKLMSEISRVATERKARIHSVAMGAQSNSLLLREVARQSGGLFRAIVPGDNVPAEAFKLALALESKLLPAPKFRFDGGGVHDVFPAQFENLVAGEEVFVMGRYSRQGRVNVTVALGENATRDEFNLPETDDNHPYVSRNWARDRLDALMLKEQTPATVREIVDLSQEFTLITPYTSFLVLEDEAAYRKYGIDRHKRRPYWEAARRLVSVPPPIEIIPGRHSAPPPETPQPQKPFPLPKDWTKSKNAPPHPLTLADLDLSFLRAHSNDGRALVTALSTMCLEVYYRYAQLQPEPPATSVEAPVFREFRSFAPAAANEMQNWKTTSRESSAIQIPPEILAKAELGDHFEVFNSSGDLDSQFPRSVSVDGGGGASSGFIFDDLINAGAATSPGSGGGWGGGFGGGTGTDTGSGRGSFGNRNGGGRRLMVKRHGGSKSTENGVDLSLRWLAYHQSAEGYWDAESIDDTSFALLAFLGAGHSQKVGEYKDNVKRAVKWLCEHRRADGKIGSSTYEHVVASLALSEAAAMANIPETRAAAQIAIDYLCTLQEKADGQRLGWGKSLERSDPLLTAWAVFALKSAKVAGLHVFHEAFDGAITYLEQITNPDGTVGEFARPQPGEVNLLNTAAIAVAHQFMGWRKDDALIDGPANLLLPLARRSATEFPDALRLRYFGTLLLFQRGGNDWKVWNAWITTQLLASQNKAGDDCGSWAPSPTFWTFRRATGAILADERIAREEIDKALDSMIGPARAYERLMAALSMANDAETLQPALVKSAASWPLAPSLVRLRLGIVLAEHKLFDEAAEKFRIVYQENGRPDNVFELYIRALCGAGRTSEALDLLVAEANEGRHGGWRRGAIGALLFDPTVGISEPLTYVTQKLHGTAAQDAELLAACAQYARRDNRRAVEVAFFERLYTLPNSTGRYVEAYAEALCSVGRQRDALNALLNEGRNDRLTPNLAPMIARLLLDEKVAEADVLDRVAKEFAAQPALRLNVYQHLSVGAEQLKRQELVAALSERMFIEYGRPESMIQAVVTNLIAAGRHAKAASELEGVIQAGFHTTWAFQTLAELYRKLGRGEAAELRAVSSETELFASDAQPHMHLAEIYERAHKPAAALAQYRAALQLKPDDPYFHKQFVERSIGLGDYKQAYEVLTAMNARFPNQQNVWGADDRNLAELLKRQNQTGIQEENADSRRQLREYFTKDLVVVLTWDTNGTDIDLHVIEADGEECFHSHKTTTQGGTLDHDVTTGLGPETYALRRAKPGAYRIDVEYYSGAPRTVATVQIYRHRNAANESVTTHKVELTQAKQRATVTTLEFGE